MTPVLSPPAKLAAQVLVKAGLGQVPIPIRDLLSERAAVQSEVLPDGYDGILVRRRGTTPKVFVAENLPETRRRFTYGHEFGHLVIPWHTGTILCPPEEYLDAESPEAQVEREANEFASEILMPSKWLQQQLSLADLTDMAEAILACAKDAQVSLAAAVRAFERGCDHAAHAVLIDASGNKVEAASKTRRWLGAHVGPWTENPVKSLKGPDVELSSLPVYGGRRLYVAVHAPSAPSRPEKASTQILRGFLANRYQDDMERKKMSERINGVIGSANTKSHSRDVSAIYSALTQRIAAQTYADILQDSSFREFLSAKAHELSER